MNSVLFDAIVGCRGAILVQFVAFLGRFGAIGDHAWRRRPGKRLARLLQAPAGCALNMAVAAPVWTFAARPGALGVGPSVCISRSPTSLVGAVRPAETCVPLTA